MRFLSILFGLCVMASLCWVCGGSAAWSAAGQKASQQQTTGDPTTDKAVSAIVGGGGIGFFACTGLPFALIFTGLALACNGAYQTERRHREMLQVQYNRNEALGNMSAAQLVQAQMEIEDRKRRLK